ncbi:hypothetical protein F2Q68_00039738 [Brassica cretica]|uniref:Endonuclease/exonuclease/phosphatase domain-containing protein n=1 Tax=Brassica cretica TaxID=69181 RepID=A0A8S9MSW4_BRACR|nr:hypothetical protein F2Q68_00039738 [Brassica cretica]
MKWGHLEQACLAPKKVLKEKTNVQVEEQTNVEVEDGEIVGSSINEIDNLEEQADTQREEVPASDQLKDKEEEQSMESDGVNDRTRVVDVEAGENMGLTEVTVRSQSAEAITPKELEWSDVSPGKASRSPKKMTEPEQVLTTSRFSVLASTEEEEEVNEDTVQEESGDSVQEGSESAENPIWKARSHAILSVLKKLQADFFCLQEVDEYDSFYRKNMESLGYSGIYIQRTGQRKRDGCAIFFKPSCAELVTKERIEYNDLLDEQKIETSNEAKGDEKEAKEHSGKDSRDLNDPQVRLKRDCVGIMAAFRINKPFHHMVIVANTHLYWDPELADVKLAQAKYLLSRLAQFKTLISDEFECTPSLLLAGDFNSIPGDMVYSYLVSGYKKPAETIEEEEVAPIPMCSVYEVTRGEPKFTNCTPGFTNTLDYIFFSPSDFIKPVYSYLVSGYKKPAETIEEEEVAPIPMCSVYEVTRGEPKFTNCTPGFTNTLDYIFFSPSDFIKPVSILQLPEPESPDVVGFLPNDHHSSDHLPIVHSRSFPGMSLTINSMPSNQSYGCIETRESPTWTDVSSGASWTRTRFGLVFRTTELDFGFSAPLLGTLCSTVEINRSWYLNRQPSACNVDSWSVSAIVWPELGAALES